MAADVFEHHTTKMYLSILIISLFAFVMAMIGALKSFFCRSWKWFLLLVACILISGVCTVIELYRFLRPAPSTDLPVINRNLTTPL